MIAERTGAEERVSGAAIERQAGHPHPRAHVQALVAQLPLAARPKAPSYFDVGIAVRGFSKGQLWFAPFSLGVRDLPRGSEAEGTRLGSPVPQRPRTKLGANRSDLRHVAVTMWRFSSSSGEAFQVSIAAASWGPPRGDTVDATTVVTAELEGHSSSRVVGFIHGSLSRQHNRFSCPLRPVHARELVEHAVKAGWQPGGAVDEVRLEDARWVLQECPIPFTKAPRYEGAAKQTLTRDLHLGTDSWMQDWPLEVADPTRVAEFCAYYDAAASDDVRFDAMALALHSMDLNLSIGPADGSHMDWFESRLRRAFPLHGHQVAYWAVIEEVVLDDENCFRISPAMRRIWQECLVEIPVDDSDAPTPNGQAGIGR